MGLLDAISGMQPPASQPLLSPPLFGSQLGGLAGLGSGLAARQTEFVEAVMAQQAGQSRSKWKRWGSPGSNTFNSPDDDVIAKPQFIDKLRAEIDKWIKLN